jgi:hypothetical protein
MIGLEDCRTLSLPTVPSFYNRPADRAPAPPIKARDHRGRFCSHLFDVRASSIEAVAADRARRQVCILTGRDRCDSAPRCWAQRYPACK